VREYVFVCLTGSSHAIYENRKTCSWRQMDADWLVKQVGSNVLLSVRIRIQLRERFLFFA
jgi:hypothetical protein